MDDEKVKEILDNFENDDFVSAQEKLKDEVIKSRDISLKDKLGLKNDINPIKDEDDKEE